MSISFQKLFTRAVKQEETRPQYEFAGNRLQRSEAGWNEFAGKAALLLGTAGETMKESV
jgi:hypothetical protein